ncbi:MAG: methionine aminotransferase [Xanthomonadales bacterium]|jgi:methionine aminotransferase|nr:methionine aminotransferase [Xanthomonadales bacterium]
MTVSLNSKLPGFGTTIFTVMSKMAAEHGAINLSQGFPDFEGPQLLRDRAAWHMAHGHNQYSPLAGVPPLLEAITETVESLYGAKIDPGAELCVTPGATEAISTAIAVTVHPGDEVLIVDPAYDCYDPCVRLNGGVPVHVPMTAELEVDWAALESACTPRTRLLVLNSPHNPTGGALREADLQALKRLLSARPMLMVLSDEVYEHMVFDGALHHSLLRDPALRDRAFVVSSFGKTYHATGWRIGYCIAPPEAMKEFLRIHQFTNFSANAPLQYALADVLRDLPEHHLGLAAFYQDKRDRFLSLMAETGFRCSPSAGTYFQLADYGALSDEKDMRFVERLTKEAGVAAIPLSPFFAEDPGRPWVRFCFAKDDETLERAVERLAAFRPD